MPYHLNFQALTLDYLLRRLSEEDIIPSHLPLREGLPEKLTRLGAAGIGTLADLEKALANAKKLTALAAVTGIDEGYLTLLRRAIGGYRPKPAPLRDYPGADAGLVAALEAVDIKDSAAFWEAARLRRDRSALAERLGAAESALLELVRLADLSRIQWVSPLYARLLHDSGFRGVSAVARASGEAVYQAVATLNAERRLFKGKIGLRDMGRLVYLAGQLVGELDD